MIMINKMHCDALGALQLQHQPVPPDHDSLEVCDRCRRVQPLLHGEVAPRVEVGQRQPFRPGPAGDVGGVLRV